MNQTRVGRGLVSIAAATAILLASACGDDDDDDAGGAAPGGGEPIKVLTFQSLENPRYAIPQVKTAAEAAVKGINDRGGINGRPLALTFCDTNFDPNQEAGCARQAVEDGAVAVVGSTSLYPNALPLLERGGVPYIGGQGLSPTELSSPVSFPLAGGVPGWFWGVAAQVKDLGRQRPAIVTQPIAAAQFSAEGAEAGLEAANIPVLRTVEAPVGAPDQSTAATEAAEGADAVLLLTVPSDGAKVFQSLKQLNYEGTVLGSSATFTDAVKTLGTGADGLALTSQTTPVAETDNPEVARFVEEMDAVDSGATKDERSITTWASYQLVAEVLKGIDGEITAATVLEAMNGIEEPIETGIFAPYATVGRTPPVPEYPRLLNPSVVYCEVRGGQIVQAKDGFFNPFDPSGQPLG